VAAGFGGGAPATFRVPPDFGSIDAVRLIGTLSFAFNVPQGTPVATVMLSSGETLPIRAGIELSERAFDRPSLSGVLQHQRAQVADDFEEVTAEGEAYLGHLYQTEMRLPAPTAASEISIVPVDPRVLLQVYGLALVGPRGVRSLEAADRSGLRRLSPSVIENTHALPRAYVLPRVQAFSPARHPALTPTQLVANRDVDVHTQVLVEGEPGLSAEPAPPTTQAIPASIQEVRPNGLRVAASADVSSYVVVTDFYHRGWVAYVDGERTRVLIANALFRAVPIEAGQHTIELRFEPLSHLVGAAVSIIALIITLGIVAFGFKAR
jgi:Bacterial membrane protein YfhO